MLVSGIFREGSFPETNSKSTWKMDGWNAIVSFWVLAYFQVLCLLVLRKGTLLGTVPIFPSQSANFWEDDIFLFRWIIWTRFPEGYQQKNMFKNKSSDLPQFLMKRSSWLSKRKIENSFWNLPLGVHWLVYEKTFDRTNSSRKKLMYMSHMYIIPLNLFLFTFRYT